MSHSIPTIGLIVNPREALWLGALQSARQHGANLLLFFPENMVSEGELKTAANVLYDLIDPQALDALVIWTGQLLSRVGAPKMEELLARYRSLPIVGMTTALGDLPSVLPDDYNGVRTAMRHLIEDHGSRKLAYIRGPFGHFEAEARYRAYQDTLTEYGLPFDTTLVAEVDSWHRGETAVRWLMDERGLRPGVDFDALLASCDHAAIQAWQELLRRGVLIPSDVAIVGFDDNQTSEVRRFSLTTVHRPMEAVGQRAVEIALGLLCGVRPLTQDFVPAPLVARASCGCLSGLRPMTDTPANPPPLEIEPLRAALVRGEAPFLATLSGLLQRAVLHGEEVALWQDILRRPEFRSVQDAAQPLLAVALAQAQACQNFQAEGLLSRLDAVSDRMAATFDLDALLALLAETLPGLGIPSGYVSVYTAERNARVLLAFDQTGRITGESVGADFRVGQRLPLGAFSAGHRSDFIVMPLYVQDEQLGFALLEIGMIPNRQSFLHQVNLLDTLRRQLSSALKGALLLDHNRQLYQQAEQARRQAEEADHLKSRFLSMVSHELRTPLSLLLGLSELLLQDQPGAGQPAPPTYHQDIERIHASAQHLDRLIRDVLDLTSSQVGQLRLLFEMVDLNAVLHNVAALGEEMARRKNLSWRAILPPGLPRLRADRTRLQQVLLNLLANAVKFTDRGGVTLEARLEGDSVRIAVCDTGLGIPLADLETIFDEFHQSERSLAHGYGGMGLGLAVTRRLVEQHGGHIWAESSAEEGRGSTFTFILPVTSLPPPAAHQPALSPPTSQLTPTILIVDDEPGLIDTHTRLILRHIPHSRLLTALDGRAALEMIRTAAPDLVLLDLRMPGLNGFDVLDALQAGESTRHIPVIVLTAQTLSERELARLPRTGTSVFNKGVLTSAELLAQVDQALAGAHRPTEDVVRLVRQAMAYIHQHYTETLSCPEMARRLGVSESHLSRCFRSQTGVTPVVYLNRYRIRQAQKFLEAGNKSIAEVAWRVGFASQAYFSRVFQREVGCSPSEYRYRAGRDKDKL